MQVLNDFLNCSNFVLSFITALVILINDVPPNTNLVESENTTLENVIKYNFSKPDMYIDINASIFEDLRVKKNSDKYEYILPNIMYGKTFFTEKFGVVNLKSNALYSKYSTNKQKTFLISH